MNSIKKNFAYNALFQIVNILIPLVTTPYLSRVLRPKGVGIYSFAYTVAYYFVTISMLGLYNYGNRSIAKVRENIEERDKIFCEIYAMQIATTSFTTLVYIVYLLLFIEDKMAWMLMPYVLSSIFDVNWYFFGVEKFKLTAIRNLLIKIISTVCIFIFVRRQSDLLVYGLIMGISFLVAQLSVWPVLLKDIHFKRPNFRNVIKHIKPNVVLFFPVVAITLYKMMDKIMLGLMINKTQVGFYESSEKIIQIPLAFISALGTVMLPRMSNLAVHNDDERGLSYIKISLIIVSAISASMCFGIMGVSKEFIPIFYGQGYETCKLLFLILMPSCIAIAFANVIRTQYLIPQEMDKIYIVSVTIGATVNLILNALLIPYFESAGAALGTVSAETFVALYQMIAIRKRIPIFEYLFYTTPFLIAGGAMFIILYYLPFNNAGIFVFFIKILLGAIIFLALSMIMIFSQKKRYVKFLGINISKWRRKQ